MFNIISHQGNANQKPQGDTTSHLPEWLGTESQVRTAGEEVEKSEPSYSAGRNVKWGSQCGKQVWQFLK